MSDLFTLFGYLPVLLLPFLIVLKIIFFDKFNNIIFYSLLFLILVYATIVISVVAIMVIPVIGQVEYPLFQKVNTLFCVLLVVYFSFYSKFFFVIYPITFVALFICFVKTKNISFVKKLTVSSIILILLFVLSLPTIISPQFNIDKSIEEQENIYKAKIASDISLLTPMKVYYADYVAISIDTYFSKKYIQNRENPDFSSEEAQLLINDYLKYKKITAELSSYYDYTFLALFCKKIKRYDEAIEYLSIAEKYGVKVDTLKKSILQEIELIKKES